jgi:hypothetical protein
MSRHSESKEQECRRNAKPVCQDKGEEKTKEEAKTELGTTKIKTRPE